MSKSDNEVVEMVNVCDIFVANPRNRNHFVYEEIKGNIINQGLKRPVTVRPINHGDYKYALICGQGRLEAFISHGEEKIPAIIKDVDEETAHLMSLAENIARRNPRSAEFFAEIQRMKGSGMSDKEIGSRLGYTTSWVNGVLTLLSCGEKNLLKTVESGHIPLYLAVDISRASDKDIQILLTTALEKGHIKGVQVNKIKKILERRNNGDKGSLNSAYSPGKKQKKLTPEELAGLYEKHILEHRTVVIKSQIVKERITAVSHIYSKLLRNEDFVSLLKKNDINDIPSILGSLKEEREGTDDL
ncbi:ParB/RepB/Spo0J family partition protein [Serratia marcescens]